jgi:type I restriction enzyme S subunit
MSANATTAAPTGRKKIAQGKEHGGNNVAAASRRSLEGAEQRGSGVPPLSQEKEQRRDASATSATLGHDSPNTSRTEGAKGNDVWPVAPLGELAADERNAITDGPFGSKLKTDHYTAAGPRVIRLKNIGDTDFVDAKAHISEEHFATLQKHRVFPGDVVIAALGEDPPRSCLVPEHLGPAIVKADCIRFKAGPRILPKFINYVLNAPDLRRYAKGIVHGVGRPRLNLGEIKALPIPVPPLPEQRRIVAEIEKQFTRLEAGVAALRRVQANLKRYRAAVLKAACEGRLVLTEAELAKQSGRAFQSGAELLESVSDVAQSDQNPRRAGRLWGAGHVPELTNEERLTMPPGWVWTKVRDVGFDPESAVQVGPMSMKSSDFTDDGIPVLNVGCVQWGRFVEPKLDHLPPAKASEFERYRIKSGDVLFTRSGTVGRCAVAQPHQDGWLMTFHLLRARANPRKCLPAFLRMVFEGATHIRRQTKEASIGSTRAGFNTNLLGNLAVPLPPLAEQTRIVAEVERRLSVVEELESVVTANLQRASRLRQSILQKAFTGQL